MYIGGIGKILEEVFLEEIYEKHFVKQYSRIFIDI